MIRSVWNKKEDYYDELHPEYYPRPDSYATKDGTNPVLPTDAAPWLSGRKSHTNKAWQINQAAFERCPAFHNSRKWLPKLLTFGFQILSEFKQTTMLHNALNHLWAGMFRTVPKAQSPYR